MDTAIPDGGAQLDSLQREGALRVFGQALEGVEPIKGPDGMEVDLFDCAIAVHAEGVLLTLMLDAPALEFAEAAGRALIEELLEAVELLSGWTVQHSGVELHPDSLAESLAAADGPDAPPDDLGARRSRYLAPQAPPSGPSPEEAAARRACLQALAPRLKAFSPVSFGGGDPGEEDGAAGFGVDQGAADLAAGALFEASVAVLDELFMDVHELWTEDTAVAGCDGPLMRLEDLPERFAEHYTAGFARRFLVTAVALTTRFTDGTFRSLGSVAEELALRLLLGQARTILDIHGLLDEGGPALDTFAESVHEGRDRAWLYSDVPAEDGAAAVTAWFLPFDDTDRYVHPFAVGNV
ncbi:hypothetical protein HNR25_002564 [Streptomonospora salina]|uniref:Uncharacterized protein n=1 Tax=Streptomonospora salina TaxID=104205 RepID=A0A841ECM3_9ACTN|nr:hypothetical protein [Streptomonospora salina]MBB5998813.1 hypothetical protein [Streptomonospora salina]